MKKDSQYLRKRLWLPPLVEHTQVGRARSMRASILRKIFRRVQLSHAEGVVIDAILSKANMFGKHARVAYECLAAITGFSIRHVKRLVKSLIYERRLLRVTKRVLWPGHNAINVYDVVIPWRREVSFEDMDARLSGRQACRPTGKSGRSYPGSDRLNNKGDKACHPKGQTEKHPLLQPARLCTEAEASKWLKPESDPWYYAQGLTPPSENGENGSNEG